MARVIDQDLLDCLRRPNPNVLFHVEVSQPNSSQILRRAVDQWLTSPNPQVSVSPAASVGVDPTGALTLAATTPTLASFPNRSAVQDNCGQQAPPGNTTRMKAMGWQVDPFFERCTIRSFSAQVERETQFGGTTWMMSKLQLQIYRVTQLPGSIQVGTHAPVAFTQYNFTPLLSPAPILQIIDQVNQSFGPLVQRAFVTWDLTNYQIVIDGAAALPVLPGQVGVLPTYYFVVSAIDFGYGTANHSWCVDTATSPTVNGVGQFNRRWWVRGSNQSDSLWVEQVFGDCYSCKIGVEGYTSAGTVVYQISMPSVAPASSTGRVVIDSNTPLHSALTVNYSKTSATGPWTQCHNGDVIPGAPQATYWMQAVMSSSFQNRTSPQIRALGIEFRTPIDLSYESKPQFTAKSLDLPFLKSSIGQLQLPLLRTGQRDYSDQVTNLVLGAPVTALEADIYLASNHPAITRDKWLLIERQMVVDRTPNPIGETFLCNSFLQKYKKKIPPKTESLATTHTVRVGTTPNNTTPFQIQVDASTPLQSTPYTGLGYYVRVKSTASPVPVGYTQTIDGSNNNAGGGLLTFGQALPGTLVDGDVVEVHSGIFNTAPLFWNSADPATVWLQLLTQYLGVDQNRIGLAGIGPYNGYPPTIAQRAPGDATTQNRLKVTNLFSSQQDASALLEQISFILGGATIEIAGQICFVQIYPTTSPAGSVTVPLPAAKVTFDPRDYLNLNITTSLQKRSVVCSCNYGVDYTSADPSSTPANLTVYVDADALNYLSQQDIEQFGNAVIPSDIAKWCFNSADSGLYLASMLSRQVVMANSTGQHVFDWTTADQYPEINIGDTVNLVTDQYVDFDPAYQAPISGWISYNLVVISVDQGGKKFKGALLGLAQLGSRLQGQQGGTQGGSNSGMPTVPTITLSYINPAVTLQKLPRPEVYVAFTPPTNDPNFARLDLLVVSNAAGSTQAAYAGSKASPIVLHSLFYGLTYTFTPVYVSTAGKRTNGTAVPLVLTAPSDGIGNPQLIDPSTTIVNKPVSIGNIHDLFPIGTGVNHIDNPHFVLAPNQASDLAVAGWKDGGQTLAGLFLHTQGGIADANSGTNAFRIQPQPSISIPASTTHSTTPVVQRPKAVLPGETYTASVLAATVGSATIPAALTYTFKPLARVNFTDGSTQDFPLPTITAQGQAYGPLTTAFTVPANNGGAQSPVSVEMHLTTAIQNTSGAAVLTPVGQAFDVHVDSVALTRNIVLATEVADDAIFARYQPASVQVASGGSWTAAVGSILALLGNVAMGNVGTGKRLELTSGAPGTFVQQVDSTGAAATQGVWGDYTVVASPTATTSTSFTGNPSTANAVVGTAGGGSGWVSATTPIVVSVTVNPIAYDGQYKLNYTQTAVGVTGAASNASITTRIFVEVAINTGGGLGSYTAYGYFTGPSFTGPGTSGAITLQAALSFTQTFLTGVTALSFRVTPQVNLFTSPKANAQQATSVVTMSNAAWKYASGSGFTRRALFLGAEANKPQLSFQPNATPPTNLNSVEGEVGWDGTKHALVMHDGDQIATFRRYEVVYLTADATSASTTYNTISGNIAVTAGEGWIVEVEGTGVGSGTAGVFVAISGNGGFSSTIYDWVDLSTSSAAGSVASNAGSSGTFPPARCIGVTGRISQRYYITIATSGNMALAIATSVNLTTTTLKRGAIMRAFRVA